MCIIFQNLEFCYNTNILFEQALVVIQDLLRIFIIRMACIHAESAAILLRPIILWIDERLSDSSTLTDTDAYKVIYFLYLWVELVTSRSACHDNLVDFRFADHSILLLAYSSIHMQRFFFYL